MAHLFLLGSKARFSGLAVYFGATGICGRGTDLSKNVKGIALLIVYDMQKKYNQVISQCFQLSVRQIDILVL